MHKKKEEKKKRKKCIASSSTFYSLHLFRTFCRPAVDGADTRAATGAENGQEPNDGVCGCQAALVCRLPALEKSIENILKLMVEEASAAWDREVRLLRKIGNLEAQLCLLQQQQAENTRNGCPSLPADMNVSVEKSAENSTGKRKTKHGNSNSPPKTNPVNVVNGVLMDSEPQDHMTTPTEIIVSPPPNTETTVEREWTLVKPKSRYEILPLAANDESRKLVSDKPQSARKAALYVGNLRPEVSESELVQFIYSPMRGCRTRETSRDQCLVEANEEFPCSMGACRTATGCCEDSPVTWILTWSYVLSQMAIRREQGQTPR